MLKKILIVVLLAVAGLLAYAATRPDSFRIDRRVTIQAPPEKIFPLIDDLHQWTAWSPWERLDPDVKRSYSGAAKGKSAAYAWEGNSKVGAGRMEITSSSPTSQIVVKLDFIKPFEGHNIAEFTTKPAGDGTEVNWSMYGPSPYISKVMGVFFSMDSLVGKDFEVGLANLKQLAEK